ncbi:CRISPR-associated protein Cas4 [Methanobrevibacter sp. OttesenSCG-928-K11]|nr:CRISPR-associated protein Cas4 [Methanobrevibacter sp. OttesenSCG-928-K11]
MISISSIKLHMYCPLKLYYKTNLGEEEKSDFLLNNEIKNLKIDIQDLIQKNMRKINTKMDLKEIEDILLENIVNYIENSVKNLEKSLLDDDLEKLEEIKHVILSETYFNLKILSLKSEKAMKSLEKDGNQIVEMFFPNSLYSYFLKDVDLNLTGTCDKIEIVDGKYYPIKSKSGKPPIKGVWDGDAIELVAQSLLIEQEFDTEVFVGFIDYTEIKERRPVIMDVHLRKNLFKILKEVKETVNNSNIPKVNFNKQKCSKCDYYPICQDN